MVAHGAWHPEASLLFLTLAKTDTIIHAPLRFTRSKDNRTVYAICLKWNGKQLTLKSVRAAEGSEIRLLGLEKPLSWRRNAHGLTIEIQESLQSETARLCKQAYSFKITTG